MSVENENIKKVIIANMFCKLLLWYDFMIFLDLSNVLARVFFPSLESSHGLSRIFGIFAVGFFARPVGACIFGHIGDRFGRKVSLLISILLISVPSGLIAFTPGYDVIGITAPVLIALFRILQGIAFGAEKGASIYLLEHSSDQKKLGTFYSITGFGKPLGMVLCSVIIILCKKYTDFIAWGWRIPFAFSLFLGTVCIYMRFLIMETIAYTEHKTQNNLSTAPLMEVINNNKRAFFLSFLISICINVIVYFAIFYRTFTKEIISLDVYARSYTYEVMLIATTALTKISSILFGILSDKVGRENIFIPCLIVIMLMCCPMLHYACRYKDHLLIISLLLVFSVIETGIVPMFLTIYELFPTKVRFSGVGLSRNLAAALFGGTTPYICLWLTNTFTQINYVAGIYVIFCCLISLIAVLHIKESDKKIDW